MQKRSVAYQIWQDSFLARSGTMDTMFPSISIAPSIPQQAHKEPGESERSLSSLWYCAMFLHPDRGDIIATEMLHPKVQLLQEGWKAVSV
jgi:hypothetical protein